MCQTWWTWHSEACLSAHPLAALAALAHLFLSPSNRTDFLGQAREDVKLTCSRVIHFGVLLSVWTCSLPESREEPKCSLFKRQFRLRRSKVRRASLLSAVLSARRVKNVSHRLKKRVTKNVFSCRNFSVSIIAFSRITHWPWALTYRVRPRRRPRFVKRRKF